ARARAAGLIDPALGVLVKDSLRVHIMAITIQRPFSPSEFAREVDTALNVASYHFKVLKEYGFIELVKTIKVRGSLKHMYRATKSGFISDTDWGEVADALKPGVAGAALHDLNTRVSQALEVGTFYTRDNAWLAWAPLMLDEIAWDDFIDMIAWAFQEGKEFEVETIKRQANGGGEGCFPVTFAIAGFPSPTHEEVKAKEREKKKGKRKRKAPQGRAKPKAEPRAKAKGKGERRESFPETSGSRARRPPGHPLLSGPVRADGNRPGEPQDRHGPDTCNTPHANTRCLRSRGEETGRGSRADALRHAPR